MPVMMKHLSKKRKNWRWIVNVKSLLLAFVVISCQKDKDDKRGPVSLDSFDVHLAANKTENRVSEPYYMKNGVLEALTHPGNAGATTRSIVVSGTDVYIAGNYRMDEGALTPSVKPVYWKNGTIQELQTAPNVPYADTRAIYVSDGDVYVAGQANVPNQTTTATVWKNGIAHPVTNGENYAGLEDIFVVGNDVYVVGYETHERINVAKYWKNGHAVTLSDGRFQSYAMSIYVDGTDVYVAGYAYEDDGCNIKLWKNGEAMNLTTGSPVAQARKVWVEGSSVYVAGYEQVGNKYEPFAWKDGKRLRLDFLDYASSLAYDAAVLNGDFFVLGTQGNSTDRRLTIWKNGHPIDIISDSQGLSAGSFTIRPK